MRKKKIIKKRVWLKINAVNISVFFLSILAGLGIVSFSNAMNNFSMTPLNRSEEIARSAIRLADAFDLYNLKRFPQE